MTRGGGDPFDQAVYAARFEWGREGLLCVGGAADVVVIVDVLSFSTCVDVAIARGATVLPYRWRDASAAAYADARQAVLAVGRSEVSPASPFSLSPASLARIGRGVRVVLPSPNGSDLSMTAGERGAAVFCACLRNATAVAGAVRRCGGSVAVIAAGERWPGEGARLRPAVEDLLGAGAVLAALADGFAPSPEAEAAIAAFHQHRDRLDRALAACASGRELRARGYEEDVRIAAALDASGVAPRLVHDTYEDAA